jgi:aspartyl-tRNA(Asn)/glutamyl-tRNA(Gln) amidotransferase subunit A
MFVDLRPFFQLRHHVAERGAVSLVGAALDRALSPAGATVFTSVFAHAARAEAEAVDRRHAAGVRIGPLAGIPISVKDLFDVAGQVTRAGSTVLADAAPAAHDAPAIARLRAAGAVIVGHTNMTEFAFSGLGLNPHFGTPANPWDKDRIPGGSSSGAAVSVALGMAAAAIGTDTGGSWRIPAAFCGLAGFKPSAARTDTRGTVPLSKSLDTVGPIAHGITDCALLDAFLAGGDQPHLETAGIAGLRFAVPQTYVLDDLDPEVAHAFDRALAALSAAGVRLVEVPFAEWAKLPDLLAGGGLVAAESYAWHRRRLEAAADRYDPRVRVRIERGRAMSAADYVDLLELRAARIRETQAAFAPFDAVVMPTVACVAPKIADLADDDAYTRANLRALRNTTVANLLDLPAATLPIQTPGNLPVGLSLVGATGGDRRLLDVAAGVEVALCAAGLGRALAQ